MSVRAYASPAVVFALLGVDLNAVGAAKDNELHIPIVRYIPRRITVTNATVSLAASPATLGLFSAAAGGGTTIVPFTTLTILNTQTKFAELAFSFSNYAQLPTVYVRSGTAHGSAALVDVYVEVTPLL